MNWIHGMMHYHPMLLGAITMAIANCAVTSLPTPEANGSKFYAWFFNTAHGLILAIPRIVSQYKADAPPKP